MARSLRDILKRRVLKKLSRTVAATGVAADIWGGVVPEKYRGHAEVLSYKRRILEVAVDAPAVLAELEGFHRQEVLEGLKERFTEAGLAPPARIKYTVQERM